MFNIKCRFSARWKFFLGKGYITWDLNPVPEHIFVIGKLRFQPRINQLNDVVLHKSQICYLTPSLFHNGFIT